MKTIFYPSLCCCFLILSCSPLAPHQRTSFAQIHDQSYQLVNRKIYTYQEGDYQGIRLSEADNSGMAWLVGENFSTGTLEFDVKGRDGFQSSFVGLAFHGQNNQNYEAIYFRPFNFQAEEVIRRAHGVQYIAEPHYSWHVLRRLQPLEFESQVKPTNIKATDWFHVRLEVDETHVRVFVNDNPQPSLEAERIRTDLTDGSVGFWVGSGSDGRFANLVIKEDVTADTL
ncbi:MAG: hypothetical protein AAF433_05890 [Bacteroidota bacterium]